jgi:hypothetical protein
LKNKSDRHPDSVRADPKQHVVMHQPTDADRCVNADRLTPAWRHRLGFRSSVAAGDSVADGQVRPRNRVNQLSNKQSYGRRLPFDAHDGGRVRLAVARRRRPRQRMSTSLIFNAIRA